MVLGGQVTHTTTPRFSIVTGRGSHRGLAEEGADRQEVEYQGLEWTGWSRRNVTLFWLVLVSKAC